MNMHVYTHKNTHTHILTYIHIYIYAHTYIYTYIFILKHANNCFALNCARELLYCSKLHITGELQVVHKIF